MEINNENNINIKIKKPIHICPTCNKEFSTKGNLKKHTDKKKCNMDNVLKNKCVIDKKNIHNEPFDLSNGDFTPKQNIIISFEEQEIIDNENMKMKIEEEKQQQIEAEKLKLEEEKQQQIIERENERKRLEELKKRHDEEAEKRREIIRLKNEKVENKIKEEERIMIEKDKEHDRRQQIEKEKKIKELQIRIKLEKEKIEKQQQIEAEKIKADELFKTEMKREKQRTKNIVETNLKQKLEKLRSEMEIENNKINKQKVELQNELNDLNENLKNFSNDKEEALLNNVFEINDLLYKNGIHYNYDEINDDEFDYDILTENQYNILTAINRRKTHKEEYIKKTYDNEIINIRKRINEIINDKENMNILKGELTDVSQSLIFEKCEKMNAFKETLFFFQQLKNKVEREKNGIKDRTKSYRNIKNFISKNGKRNKTVKFNKIRINI